MDRVHTLRSGRGRCQRINAYARELEDWFERIEELSARGDASEVIAHILGDPAASGWSELDRQVAAMCIRGAIASVNTGED